MDKKQEERENDDRDSISSTKSVYCLLASFFYFFSCVLLIVLKVPSLPLLLPLFLPSSRREKRMSSKEFETDLPISSFLFSLLELMTIIMLIPIFFLLIMIRMIQGRLSLRLETRKFYCSSSSPFPLLFASAVVSTLG